MLKTELTTKLDIVAPALSTVDVLPVLTMLWFTGKELIAYNDQIGISTPLQTKFVGAVPGRTLIDLIHATYYKEIDLTTEGQELFIKAGSSRIKQPMLNSTAFENLFTMPDGPRTMKSAKKDLIRASVEHCMRSTNLPDTSRPDTLGINFIPDGKRLSLFSTSGHTLSHAGIETDMQICKSPRANVPTSFCKEFLRLTKDKDYFLRIEDDYAIVRTAEASLFGKLIEDEHPLDLRRVLQNNTSDMGKMVELPQRLKVMFERAVIVSGPDNLATQIAVNNGRMRFFTSSPSRGEVTDVIQIDHADVKAKVAPKHLVDACEDFDRFIVTDQAVIMKRSDANRTYIVSTRP